MASSLVNRAKMTVSGAPGTGTITLLAAATGFDTFANAGVATGATVSYYIEDGSAWEYGTGTYTSSGTSLTRTVGRSSAGTTAISLTSAAVVGLTALANDIARPVNRQQFDSSATWTKPNGYGASAMAHIRAWGAGGSGSKYSANGAGGGGGEYVERWISLSSMGATETITIGAGGAAKTTVTTAGAAGGSTSVGSLLTAAGGTGGIGSNGGDGGATLLRAVISVNVYTICAVTGADVIAEGKGAYNGNAGLIGATAGRFIGGGGGCQGVSVAGAGSLYGGGGGGGAGGTGGTSSFGGSGGAGGTTTSGTAGTAPGGGGGGTSTGTTSGAGAAGRVIITVFDGV